VVRFGLAERRFWVGASDGEGAARILIFPAAISAGILAAASSVRLSAITGPLMFRTRHTTTVRQGMIRRLG
jgi:hypothetical protein